MAKDPAFLFYPGDWLGGTMGMTLEQKGAYIELLMMQFNHGKFTEAQAKQVLSICFDVAWATIKQKFNTDGIFYWNERLLLEIEKRKKFTESRRINALHPKNAHNLKGAYAQHMLQHMENENTVLAVKGDSKGKNKFIPPPLPDFKEYFIQNGFSEEIAERAWKGYDVANWHKSNGKPVKNWKQTCQQVWFRDENKHSNISKSVTNNSDGTIKMVH